MASAGNGASAHGDGCGCVRCTGFQPGNEHRVEPGNDLATKTGAYASIVKLTPEIDQVAGALEELVPVASRSDRPTISLLATALVRISRAEQAIADAEGRRDYDGASSIRSSQRRWVNTAGRLADQLGLSPSSRVRLGLDLALGYRALAGGISPDRLREALNAGEISFEDAATFSRVWRILLGQMPAEFQRALIRPAPEGPPTLPVDTTTRGDS